MARISPLSMSLFLTLIIFGTTVKDSNVGGEGSLRPDQCCEACDYRCSNAHYPKRCLFYCDMCCKKCLCVPSGTYGHKEECPCYNNWKSKQGKPKCP
ncbi:gibberellin-regulated protein 12-like [Carica papaya]|uniref:gibberellin-regulated protein 12-like n=1 Tax=Carica papaya TaxID=3649 RepID=UPI000B8CA7E1|nr:gibberellin-regulated protein 12-like [Carica papaya]